MGKIRRAMAKFAAYRQEALWLLIGKVSNLVFAVVSLKFLTSVMALEEFGRFSLAVAIANAGAMFIFSPYGSGVLRTTNHLVVHHQTETLQTIFGRYLLWLTAAVALVGGVAAVVAPALQDGLSLPFNALTLAFLLLLGLQLVTFNAIQSMRMRKSAAIFQGLNGLQRGLVAIPFVLLLGPSAEYALIGIVIALTIQVGVQWRFVWRGITEWRPAEPGAPHDRLTTIDARQFIRICLPLIVIFGLTTVSRYSDRFLVAGVLSLRDLGVLAAFLQIARSVSLLTTSFSQQMILPIVFSEGKDAESHGTKKRIILIAWLAIVVFVGMVSLVCALFAPWIVGLLTTEECVPHAMLLPAILFGQTLAESSRILEADGMMRNRTWLYVAPKMLEALALVTTMLLAVPVLGLPAVPLAYVVSAGLLSVAYLVLNFTGRPGGGTNV